MGSAAEDGASRLDAQNSTRPRRAEAKTSRNSLEHGAGGGGPGEKSRFAARIGFVWRRNRAGERQGWRAVLRPGGNPQHGANWVRLAWRGEGRRRWPNWVRLVRARCRRACQTGKEGQAGCWVSSDGSACRCRNSHVKPAKRTPYGVTGSPPAGGGVHHSSIPSFQPRCGCAGRAFARNEPNLWRALDGQASKGGRSMRNEPNLGAVTGGIPARRDYGQCRTSLGEMRLDSRRACGYAEANAHDRRSQYETNDQTT